MAKATCNGVTIAASDETRVVEGNHYFPLGAVDQAYLEASPVETFCGWKGTAKYYDVLVDGQRHEQAAWYYPDPKQAAEEIRGYIAFWKGVEVED